MGLALAALAVQLQRAGQQAAGGVPAVLLRIDLGPVLVQVKGGGTGVHTVQRLIVIIVHQVGGIRIAAHVHGDRLQRHHHLQKQIAALAHRAHLQQGVRPVVQSHQPGVLPFGVGFDQQLGIPDAPLGPGCLVVVEHHRHRALAIIFGLAAGQRADALGRHRHIVLCFRQLRRLGLSLRGGRLAGCSLGRRLRLGGIRSLAAAGQQRQAQHQRRRFVACFHLVFPLPLFVALKSVKQGLSILADRPWIRL